jgi:SAM-dependent methyltransferase
LPEDLIVPHRPLAYRCPSPGCDRTRLEEAPSGLACPNGHVVPFVPGTTVPVFCREPDDANEYASGGSAEKHDNALRWVLQTFHADEAELRRGLVARLQLREGGRALITGAGTGNDLPYLAQALGRSGEIYAQDIAQQMLLAGVERHRADVERTGIKLHFSVSDATNLPFGDGEFDAAYHFGGINLFADVRRGIAEMNRVVKAGGRVVIGDEGVAPWLRSSEIGRMLIRNNALYACEVPLGLLPETVRSPRVSWELCNTFYVIEFSVATDPLPIDIDVPHLGTRGGTVRTRYQGQLEGVDPGLRDLIYAEADRRGQSRVEYLESLLRRALSELPGAPDRG